MARHPGGLVYVLISARLNFAPTPEGKDSSAQLNSDLSAIVLGFAAFQNVHFGSQIKAAASKSISGGRK